MEKLTELQEKVLNIIQYHGKTEPITGKAISKEAGMVPRDSGKEGADLRAVINALRTKGWPICANGNGYYYAYTSSELSSYIGSLEARIAKETEALEGLKMGFDRAKPRDPNNFNIAQPSATIPKKEYIISVTDGVKRCNCPSFSFRSTCKHVNPPELFENNRKDLN